MLATGTKAPGFTLPDQNGNMHSLSEYSGKKVLLYFYPKDNTSGCSKQAYDIRKEKKLYEKTSMGVVRTTYNGDIFPFMREFISHLTERGFRNKTDGFIENGSWAPLAAKKNESYAGKLQGYYLHRHNSKNHVCTG